MYRNQTLKYLGSISLLSVLLISFQNCQSNFRFEPSISQASLAAPPVGDGVGGDSGPGTTARVLKSMKPALAVRGMACLMCHADIRANVITDFGYGDPFYLGAGLALDGNASGGNDSQSWYNNDAHSWQSMRNLNGTVFVPDQLIPSSVQSSMGLSTTPPMNLEKMLSTPYQATWNWGSVESEGVGSMIMKVTPALGEPKVKSVSQIVIRSPSEAEIVDLAMGSGASVTRIGDSAEVQLINQSGASGVYFKNDEAKVLQCSNSDIVVLGTLYLRNLKVDAKKGCRLYVKGSVFIENAITYSDDDPTQNIQITSSNAIIMGINYDNLSHRWDDRRQAKISDPLRSFDDRFKQVLAEAKNIGSLKDAADEHARDSINFKGLLLNAPIVHSRYSGSVQGTIIAQLALFSLGDFHFKYDDVFSAVDVFPLLVKPILSVK